MYTIPNDCGYNKIFKHSWKTTEYAIPMTAIDKISKIVSGKWGWHFIPNKNMNYTRQNWYEDQILYLTFENKFDLILCKLMISINK